MEAKDTDLKRRRSKAKKRAATDICPLSVANDSNSDCMQNTCTVVLGELNINFCGYYFQTKYMHRCIGGVEHQLLQLLLSVEILEADGNYDMNEPTMGEKLEMLRVQEDNGIHATSEKEPSPDIKFPSADSVHVLLKQALNAEDHQLLLNCLNTRDEKVISNSVAELCPVHVIRLLNSPVSITNSRGSVLVCALPWLRSLLIHHASSIMAQESSLSILNSLYQIISDELDEESIPPPVIFEDKDTDDEESDGDMVSEEENPTQLTDGVDLPYESDGSDVMSQ